MKYKTELSERWSDMLSMTDIKIAQNLLEHFKTKQLEN